jgi:WD repeat-containing protein 19
MANRKEEAFIIAQTHGEMDTYADCLKDCTAEERTVIAQYYEGKSLWDKAAKQYELAKNPMKSLKLYQKAGEDFIPQMLELVSMNKSQENLIQELLDYLMGETDEQPKDPIHTYRLYRILGNYKNAAKIAVTIASQEQ